MIQEIITFIRSSAQNFNTVGAIAPSSKNLAKKITQKVASKNAPAHILEVGAGTGVITTRLGEILNTGDHLDICELNQEFVKYLEQITQTNPVFQNCKGTYQIHPIPVQQIQGEACYDYIVCGLPFNAFPPALVKEILSVLLKLLKPNGWFSYFEYAALRHIHVACALGQERQRIHGVHHIMSSFIKQYQVQKVMVLGNFPPAYVRHCQKK